MCLCLVCSICVGCVYGCVWHVYVWYVLFVVYRGLVCGVCGIYVWLSDLCSICVAHSVYGIGVAYMMVCICAVCCEMSV